MDEEAQSGQRVIFFRLYPARVGDKITIEGGPWRGDWEIIEVGERKLRLKCPITHKEIERERFFYFLEERPQEPWPHRH
ncbi:MAG: hypothetical protein ACUVXF_02870 [Desulfobaccales bacterium]